MLSALIPRAPALEREALVACVVLLAGAAWLGLGFSTNSRLFHWHHLDSTTVASTAFLMVFVAGWTVMTVAMMLPSTLPVLLTLHTFAAQRSDRALLLGLAVLGYVLTWGMFGVLVYVGYLVQSPLHAGSVAVYGGPVMLIIAGAFQFSSLKHKCLEKCRSPFSFVMAHWQGQGERWQAFRLGVDHGIFCVGCCWALMLLMFAVSVGSLTWMMVLAMVMAVEKTAPWGRRLSTPLGIGLMGWGVMWLLV